MKKEHREIIELAAQLDFTFVGYDGNGHIELKHKSGARATVASTPSDYRSRRNELATLERIAGRKLPRVRHRRSHKACKPSGFSVELACKERASWHVSNDDTIDELTCKRDELIELCRRHAQRRGTLREIPPLLDRINAIELRLRAMGQPVETFDPFTLTDSE